MLRPLSDPSDPVCRLMTVSGHLAGSRTERARDPGVERVPNAEGNYARNIRLGRVGTMGRFRL